METWRRNLYVLWVVIFLAAISWTMVMPFMPIYLKDLGLMEGIEFWAGVITAAASLSGTIMSPVWGAIGDRFGRRLGMLRAGAFLVVGYMLLALVRSPVELFLTRVLIAILTGFVPMAVALVGVTTPREHVGRALGLVQTAWPSGQMIGPMFGGALADWLGLRAPMWIAAATLAIVTAAAMVMVKEQFTPPPRDNTRSILQDLKTAASYPLLLPIILVSTVTMSAVMAQDPMLVPFLQNLIGPDAPSWLIGLLYSVTGLAFIVATPWWARRGEQLGFQRTVALGMLIAALLYLPQALVTNVWQLVFLRILTGMAMGAVSPGVAALLATAVPRDLRGRAFGLNQSAGQLGSVLGPLLGGAIASFIGQRGVFVLVSGIMIIGYLWVTRVLAPRLSQLPETTG